MEKVMITGISGSGGSYLADWLVENKSNAIEVHGLSRWHSTSRKPQFKNSGIVVHECDMTDFGSLLRTINFVKPDYIFNFASFANVRASFDYPLAVLQNNIMSTANLFEVVRHLKESKVYTRILHCSTSEVYGQVSELDVPIKETQKLSPVNPYSVSKTTQDLLAQTYAKAYGLDIVITRMFTYLNARRNDLFATNFARQLLQIKMSPNSSNVLKHGNLNSIRSIIDIRDACNAYYYAMMYGTYGKVYNIGGETTISVEDFLFDLIEKLGVEVELVEDVSLLRPVDVLRQIPDVTQFKRATKWEPKFSYDESLDYFLSEVKERLLNND